MYLHLGQNEIVSDHRIIGIFDLDNASVSKRTRNFLTRAEQEGRVIPCDDLPKAYVLATEYGMDKVYLTSLSSSTLEKRMK